MLKNTVLDCFGEKMRKILGGYDWRNINEIRVRAERPVILKSGNNEYFVNNDGQAVFEPQNGYIAEHSDLEQMVNMISDYSLYSVQEQLRKGFITVRGGHRAAFAGSYAVENGQVCTVKNIGSINIRIAGEIKNCADDVLRFFGRGVLKNTLIISPVCGGKTTLLRDMARQLSEDGATVGIADERGEIAACYMGVPQLDVGARTDVIDGCPKADAISMLIRTMSPELICADEIGAEEDFSAMREAALSGAFVICTAHGRDEEDIYKKFGYQRIAEIFDRLIVLEGRNNIGKIKHIANGRGEKICL